MRPKLLVVELWGLGDLAIATPFLCAASKKYDVTLLAKPFAADLAPHLWPGIQVVPFLWPWTSFENKYHLLSWPWRKIGYLLAKLKSTNFDIAISARWDPRDHLIMKLVGARVRLGFGRLGSGILLSQHIAFQLNSQHRFRSWEILAERTGIAWLERPRRDVRSSENKIIVVHSGAGQKVRVWALNRFAGLVDRLRRCGHQVQVLCDPEQRDSWLGSGETEVASPGNIAELVRLLRSAALFIGNDSGPGHLAAALGVPTFTVFGPQLPELFAPIHRDSEWIEGRPCRYKPCFDACHFPVAYCLTEVAEQEVWNRVRPFIERHLET
jgi:ADP-heptose:LPS heptosyltransferase